MNRISKLIGIALLISVLVAGDATHAGNEKGEGNRRMSDLLQAMSEIGPDIFSQDEKKQPDPEFKAKVKGAKDEKRFNKKRNFRLIFSI